VAGVGGPRGGGGGGRDAGGGARPAGRQEAPLAQKKVLSESEAFERLTPSERCVYLHSCLSVCPSICLSVCLCFGGGQIEEGRDTERYGERQSCVLQESNSSKKT